MIVISWLLILISIAGIVSNAAALKPSEMFRADNALVLVVRLMGVVCGVFMLRRHNWARWASLAWLAFHVVIGFLNSMGQGIVHAILFGIIAWPLFRPEVNAWFRGNSASAH